MSGWVVLNSVTRFWSAFMKSSEPHSMSQYLSWTAPSAGTTVGCGVATGASVLMELSFLEGRSRLEGYQIESLLTY